jgi:V/A-type H+/Na+-transporting ATPase subunit C
MQSSGVSGYAAVHSRVRVMYSTLLTSQDEARLIDAPDLPGLVSLLKDTPYGQYLTSLEDRDLTPRRIVHQIRYRLSYVYLGLIHAAPINTRSLLVELFRHFEIDNLKAVLRAIVTNSPWEQVQEILFPLGSLTTIPAERMLEVGSVESAIPLLSDTPYYDTISHAMKRYSEEQSLFPLEVALDLNYWRTLWVNANRLATQDRMQAMRVLGPLVDMINVMWALRYRVYHHLSEEEVINYTLPLSYRVRDDDIRAIAAGADIARVIERIYTGLTNVDSLLEEPENGLPKLELQLQRRIREQFKTAFTGYPFHIGLPLAFLLLNELELQDLTVLIEAKAARMPTEEFIPYLLLSPSLEGLITA